MKNTETGKRKKGKEETPEIMEARLLYLVVIQNPVTFIAGCMKSGKRPVSKHEGRGHDAEKLRDIIESLRCGKQKKLDSNESDDDFQESFEELDQENGGTANPKLDTAHVNSEMEISELEKQLKELQVESKKAHLRQQIEKEKESLRTIHRSALTLPEGLQPSSLQQPSATDDFLVIEDTMFNCNRGLHLLIRTLRELGYNINWSKVEGPAQRITFLDGASRPLDLEITVGRLKTKGWAESTSGTYRTHLKTYVQFCEEYEFKAVPCDEKTVEFYVAYLVDKKHFAYSSIRSYINIISILHKMHNLQDPISNSWNIKHLLTGVKRELGTNKSCKAPVTPELLLSMKKVLDMSNHNNIVFWAACLTGFLVSYDPIIF
ncbi:Hypothetical predicted protein [Mytilus galloprovincialis]|uniref:Integrase SAM-like N-terminal domain-containing protein n=1 Tax=Mytilus galloprovincialis TaxID=29158 RepID=A0A8B6DHV4_MYTGA|nr:Hypothetical predicted protein [Mytilus galloprovincialis]